MSDLPDTSGRSAIHQRKSPEYLACETSKYLRPGTARGKTPQCFCGGADACFRRPEIRHRMSLLCDSIRLVSRTANSRNIESVHHHTAQARNVKCAKSSAIATASHHPHQTLPGISWVSGGGGRRLLNSGRQLPPPPPPPQTSCWLESRGGGDWRG